MVKKSFIRLKFFPNVISPDLHIIFNLFEHFISIQLKFWNVKWREY